MMLLTKHQRNAIDIVCRTDFAQVHVLTLACCWFKRDKRGRGTGVIKSWNGGGVMLVSQTLYQTSVTDWYGIVSLMVENDLELSSLFSSNMQTMSSSWQIWLHSSPPRHARAVNSIALGKRRWNACSTYNFRFGLSLRMKCLPFRAAVGQPSGQLNDLQPHHANDCAGYSFW